VFCFPVFVAVVAGMQQDWVTELKAVGPEHCRTVPQLGIRLFLWKITAVLLLVIHSAQ